MTSKVLIDRSAYRTEAENRIDAHGGVRCSHCDKPMFMVELSPDFGVLVGTLRIRIKHKACGSYNVVNIGSLTYS